LPENTVPSAWKRFWNRGGFWKALLLAAVYYGLYQLMAVGVFFTIGSLAGPADGPLALLVGTALPIALGGLLLVLFGWSIGWLRELFGPQPIRGRGWMWIAVAVVLVFNILRFLTIDYTAAGLEYVLTWLLAGLFIGFAEEVLTRGYVIRIMRKAGHPEIAVALVSAALFALLHATNLLTGQAIVPTLLQVLYTFFFGICMYLALRVTGTLIAPILIHASTDPSIFLQTAFPAAGPLTAFSGLGNIAVIITGLILVFFIRGRIQTSPDATQ